jgi:hypothetical protein
MKMSRNRNWLAPLIGGAMMLAAVAPANAQLPPCAPHDEMVSRLGETYQEKRHAYGVVGGQAILEVFVSDKGSWTIIVTRTSGDSCVLAAGTEWEDAVTLAGEGV